MRWQFSFIRTWQDIQDKLNQIGGINAWLVNAKGQLLAGNNALPPFCAQVQKSLEGQKKCARDYRENCSLSRKAKKRFSIFKCHAGLTNFAVPIIINNQVLGAIVGSGTLVDEKDGHQAVQQTYQLKSSPANYLSNLKASPHPSPPDFQQTVEAILPAFQTLIQTLDKQLKSFQTQKAFAFHARWNQMMQDDLTGLGNKQYLHYCLLQELSASKRRQSKTCLLAVRLENLEALNQKYGHPTGDAFLKKFAKVLTKTARDIDLAIRYEGNVFVLLLPHSDQQQGAKVAHRLSAITNKRLAIARKRKLLPDLELRMGLLKCTPAHKQPEILADSIRQALKQANVNGQALGILPPFFSHPVKLQKRRVVITGVGIVSPLGCDKETFRQAIYEGRSGIRRITLFDPEEFPCQIGGEVRDFDPLQFIDATKLAMIGRATCFAIAAAKMAIADAKLELAAEERKRVGVYIGSAVAGLEFGENQVYNFLKFGAEEISPYLSIVVFGGAISSETSIALKIKGHSATLSTGCAAGTDAIGETFHQIREDQADIIITGGVDAPIRRVIFGSFCTIEALSTRYNECPEKASRPFDRQRDGFVIAEGAGILILEELQHALNRGAHIYGEILGFGATNDAYHMSQPDPEGEAAAEAIRLALRDARLEPKHIEYINAHGSSTPLNDPRETKVIKKVFGRHAYKLAVSSTKSMLGHPIGASGGLELIACLLGMESNFIPPTINYEFFDPDCDLDYIPNQARHYPFNIFLSNSLGFGGKNTSIIVNRY